MTRAKRLMVQAAALLAALVIVPILSVGLLAAVATGRVGNDPTFRSASLIVGAANAREPFAMPVAKMLSFEERYGYCAIKQEALGDIPAGPREEWEGWNAREAAVRLGGTLNNYHFQQMDKARDRYIGAQTSEFSRHFLLGCMEATLISSLCARRVASLVKQFEMHGPVRWERERLSRITSWNKQTMCAFLRGALTRTEQ